MPKAVLLFDAIAWVDEDGVRNEADGKGAEVDLPSGELARLKKLGAVAAASSSRAAKNAAAEEASEEPAEEPSE